MQLTFARTIPEYFPACRISTSVVIALTYGAVCLSIALVPMTLILSSTRAIYDRSCVRIMFQKNLTAFKQATSGEQNVFPSLLANI